MKRTHWPLALAVLVATLAWAFDAPAFSDPSALLSVGVLLEAAPSAQRLVVPWNRKREPMKTFQNVAASSTCFSKVPRYPRTILSMLLFLGGTTFTKALITRIELFLGSKSIWGPVSATEVQVVNTYVFGKLDEDVNVLAIDFTAPNVKELGGEQIGGLDLTTLPEGELTLEVDIGAATAPTLTGEFVWSAPQGGGDMGRLMQKLVRKQYPSAASGEFVPEVDLRGSIAQRHFMFYTGATAAVVAAQTGEGVVNVGDGVFGAVAVAARTRTGRYRARCIEPAAAAGRFALFDPDGRPIGTFTVAVAFDIGGLSGTLADGAADFVAGDGFFIDVGSVSGNLNRVQLLKNEDTWWDYTDFRARWEQKRYGRTPLTQLYVVDLLQDNHGDSVMDTAGARALDYKLNFTVTDTLTLISQVLSGPLAVA